MPRPEIRSCCLLCPIIHLGTLLFAHRSNRYSLGVHFSWIADSNGQPFYLRSLRKIPWSENPARHIYPRPRPMHPRTSTTALGSQYSPTGRIWTPRHVCHFRRHILQCPKWPLTTLPAMESVLRQGFEEIPSMD